MNALQRILLLCRKELLLSLKDRRSRMVLIVPAILQTLVFGYGATYDLDYVPYAVLDEDHSEASRELLARFRGSPIFHEVAVLDSARDVAPVIDGTTALLVVHFSRDFARQLASGGRAPLQIVTDGRNANTAGTAASYVDSIVADFNTEWRKAHGGAAPALEVQARTWYNPNLQSRWSIIPGMIAALTMLQTLLLAALSVARERERGTFDQLLVTPLGPFEIMAGKALPSLLIGLAQATAILLVSLLWFRIPLDGSVLTLYGGLVVFIVASVGMGLSISALTVSMQQAMLSTFVLIIPLMLLSGLIAPIPNMPHVIQYLTLLDPLRYGIELAQRVCLEGAHSSAILEDLWPLAGISAITLPAAAWLFRHRLI
jgi:ABC-2 type transport system permease protein